MNYIGFQMIATYQLLSSWSMFSLIPHACYVDCFVIKFVSTRNQQLWCIFCWPFQRTWGRDFATRSLNLCVCFVYCCLSFCPFSRTDSVYLFCIFKLILRYTAVPFVAFFQNKNNFVLSSFNVYTFISVYSFFQHLQKYVFGLSFHNAFSSS